MSRDNICAMYSDQLKKSRTMCGDPITQPQYGKFMLPWTCHRSLALEDQRSLKIYSDSANCAMQKNWYARKI